FVVDKPNWAYENIVKTWLPYLLERYSCYIIYQEDYFIKKANNHKPLQKIIYNCYAEIKNMMGRKDISKLHSDGYFFKDKNFKVYELPSTNWDKKLLISPPSHFNIIIEMAYYFQYTAYIPFSADIKLVGLYTDSFPHEGPTFDIKTNTTTSNLSREEFYLKYLKSYDGIIVGNLNLYDDYKTLTNKLVFANGIYRQDDFKVNTEIGNKDTLTIGWTGNPNRPMKGFREVIEPAVEQVIATGRKIKLKTQFSGSYDELIRFYHDVDLIVIASEADTGPSLFSEACLSGIPSISTRIGFPKMVIKDNVNGLFVQRDIREMQEAMIILYDNREKLKEFSIRIKKDYLALLDNKISIDHITEFISQLNNSKTK
ncbi:MAG: glycosyltransferase, partial [Chryseobacterium sp.]|nr:glycosyltransferase [Candidatus Chryseobacterium enterohippi]